ncbi:MAG: diguanylate cyclase [Candidatus Bruticola sp.]
MDLPSTQELQEKYIRVTNEHRRTLVRLRNAKLIIGVIDRLDAAISNLEVVGHIFVDTLIGRLNAKKAAIFVKNHNRDSASYNRQNQNGEEDPIAKYLGKFTSSVKEKENNDEFFHCIYQVNLNISQQNFSFIPNKQSMFWLDTCNGHPFSTADDIARQHAALYADSLAECNLDKLGLYYWIPLLHRLDNSVLGIIGLDISDPEPLELEFIEQLTAQGIRALRNAIWYKQLEASRAALARQIHKLETLYDVGKALSAIDDREHLIKDILRYAASIVQAQKASIMLLNESTGYLEVAFVHGIDQKTEDNIKQGTRKTCSLKIGEGTAGQVAKTRVPTIINNAADNPMFVRNESSNVSSIMCVPLVVHDDLQGVLNITNKEMGAPFTSDDLQIILQVADQAAVALYNAHLYELAVTDGLTKVFIRRHFFSKFSEEIRRVDRSGAKLSLIMLDIDFFKSVNDTYGHQCGDYVLYEVASVLRSTLRDVDIIGRYGGEEFAIVLIDSDIEGAVKVACRIQHSLEQHRFTWKTEESGKELELRISVSIGISCHSKPDSSQSESGSKQVSSQSELIKAADAALYYSKHHGRNRATVYSDKVNKFMESLNKKENEILSPIDPNNN